MALFLLYCFANVTFADELSALCRFVDPTNGKPVIGAVLADDSILPLQKAHIKFKHGQPSPFFDSLPDFFKDGGAQAKALAQALMMEARNQNFPLLKKDDVKLLSPLDPVKLIAGSIFEGHATQSRAAWAWELSTFQWAVATLLGGGLFKPPEEHYADVTYYQGNHLDWVPYKADIRLPKAWKGIDFEIEIAMLIVQNGSQFEVGGFFLFNDLTHRQTQGIEIEKVKHGFSVSKHLNSVGWKFILAEQVDFSKITATAKVIKADGSTKPLCKGSTIDAIFSPHEMLESIKKRDGAIHHGQVITTGSLSGCSGLEILGAAEADMLLPNDRIIFESNLLGDLENNIVSH